MLVHQYFWLRIKNHIQNQNARMVGFNLRKNISSTGSSNYQKLYSIVKPPQKLITLNVSPIENF